MFEIIQKIYNDLCNFCLWLICMFIVSPLQVFYWDQIKVKCVNLPFHPENVKLKRQ